MDRKEQLRFCSRCKHQAFDKKRGIICSLTGEHADFEEICPTFSGNLEEIEAEIANEIKQQEKNEDLIESGRHFKISELVIPGKTYFFTPLLLYANIILFVAMVASGANLFSPSIHDLIKWGGDYKLLTINGQYWRLITALFVHAGIIHLFANMYAFLIVAILLEPLIGRYRFGLAYLFSGIAASITSIWLNVAVIGVGASGAILGLYGIYISLITTSTVSKKTRLIILPSMLVYALYIIASGLMNAIVDNAAHLGGFITGIIFGYAFYSGIVSPEEKSKSRIHILIAITAVILFGYIVFNSNSPNVRYQKLLATFYENNEKGTEAYNFNETDPDEEILHKLKTGEVYWRNCINTTFQIEMIDGLSGELKNIISELRAYSNNQQIICGNMERKIKTHSNRYDTDILVYSNKVDNYLKSGFIIFFINKKFYSPKQAFFKLRSIQNKILVVVDGVPLPGKHLTDLDPGSIDSIHFLNEDAAEKLYGPMASWGAYMVKMSK